MDSSPFSKIQLYDLNKKSPKSFQKNLKNSAEKPDVPGVLLFLHDFKESNISDLVNGFSNNNLSSCESLGISYQ